MISEDKSLNRVLDDFETEFSESEPKTKLFNLISQRDAIQRDIDRLQTRDYLVEDAAKCFSFADLNNISLHPDLIRSGDLDFSDRRESLIDFPISKVGHPPYIWGYSICDDRPPAYSDSSGPISESGKLPGKNLEELKKE